ncbi:hypothetical protein [Streptomyces canus]|uniref:hypothetical protein n=1 Tax=Streptomyces canus TaxID=58343 RepID=UPI002251B1EF|nr:hypothetical protein [Streptomyces canus]MCX4862446.1 hypothetical protein [Streptomyces canus]
MAEQEARRMLPDVQKYIESLDAAVTAREAAVKAAGEKYPQRFGYSEDNRRQALAYDNTVDTAYAECESNRATAWEALKASSDPLVKWIAENCASYKAEAHSVLSALPATVSELDDLADRKDWCGVWDTFRQRAIDAGVMPGVTPPSPARQAVFDLIDRESCCPMGTRTKQRVGKALDALIQEAVSTTASATEAKTAEAPA